MFNYESMVIFYLIASLEMTDEFDLADCILTYTLFKLIICIFINCLN